MKPINGVKRIGRFFTFLTDGVYRAVSAGPLGRIFGGYERADQYFHESALLRVAQPKRRRYRAITLRGRIATAMDRSVLRRGAYGLMQGLLRCSLRTVGCFFLTGGVYSALISWLIAAVWQTGSPNGFYLFLALGIALFGGMLLFSDRSVGYAIYKGRLTGALLHNSLGVSSDSVKEIPEQGKSMYAVAVPLGMVFGSITAFTGPVYPAVALLLLAVMLIVLTTPESGILLGLIFAPFARFLPYGELWLVLVAVLSGLGYLGKLMRGTRAFRMEIQDFAVLLLLLGTLFTGFSAAGGSAWRGVCLSVLLMLIYFPAVNILATPIWLQRCRWGLLFSATVTALVGIVQFVLALITALQGVRDFSMDALGGAVRAGFTDNTVLAYFMILAFPFTLYAFLRARNAAHRTTAGLSCVMVLAATVLTWAQSAWLALLLEIVIITLLCKKQSFPYVLILVMLIPVVLLLLPSGYRAAFFAFIGGSGITTGSSLAAKVFFAGGSGFFSNSAGALRMLFGFGVDGLNRVCALYGVSDTGKLSFWWTCLFEGGLLGVLLPVLLLFFLLQNCFSALPHDPKASSAVAPASGIAMVAGAILLGFFDYAWRDPAALLLFFTLCAIVTADARHRRTLHVRPAAVVQTAVFAELEYRVKKTHDKHKNARKEDVTDESK